MSNVKCGNYFFKLCFRSTFFSPFLFGHFMAFKIFFWFLTTKAKSKMLGLACRANYAGKSESTCLFMQVCETNPPFSPWPKQYSVVVISFGLRGVEWVHDLFLFPLVLGKMLLPHAKLGLFCVV